MTPAIYELRLLVCKPDALERMKALQDWEARWLTDCAADSTLERGHLEAYGIEKMVGHQGHLRRHTRESIAQALADKPELYLVNEVLTLARWSYMASLTVLRHTPK